MRTLDLEKLQRNILFWLVLFLCVLNPIVLSVVAEESPKPNVDATSREVPLASTSDPLYSQDKPEWVAVPDLLEGNVHRVCVSTELLDSEEACRLQMDAAILDAARRYVNQHLLSEPIAKKLDGLNATWVRENWLVPNREWMVELTRPSGVYHQLWGQLEIFPEDRQQVHAWYHDLDIRRRSLICLLICLSVGGFAGAINMGLRFFRRRQTI